MGEYDPSIRPDFKLVNGIQNLPPTEIPVVDGIARVLTVTPDMRSGNLTNYDIIVRHDQRAFSLTMENFDSGLIAKIAADRYSSQKFVYEPIDLLFTSKAPSKEEAIRMRGELIEVFREHKRAVPNRIRVGRVLYLKETLNFL